MQIKLAVTMRLVTLFVFLIAVTKIRCITNQEFFDLVKDHVQDLESVDPSDVSDGSNDDVIQLLGNGNDELDVPFLLSKIELPDSLQNLEKETLPPRRRSQTVGWFRIIFRGASHVIRWFRGGSRRRRNSVSLGKAMTNPRLCHFYLDDEYRINLDPGPLKFRLNACLKLALLTGPDDQIALSITSNKKQLYQKQISLSDTSTSCVPVAKLGKFADACIETYRPDPMVDDSCVRLISNIALKAKRYKLYSELWCGPMPEAIDDKDIRRLLENVQVSVENEKTGEFEDIPMDDLTTLYRELQDEQGFDKGLEEKGGGNRKSQDFSIEE